jgi:hypothetical protein
MAWDDDKRERDWNGGRRYTQDRDRGTWERAGDEMRSWFGDDEAERRRRQDEYERGRYWGRGDDYDERTYGQPWARNERLGEAGPRGRYDDYDSVDGPGTYPGDYYNRGFGWYGRGFGLGFGAGWGPSSARPFGPDYGNDARDIGYGGPGSDVAPDDVPRYARGRHETGPHAGRGPEGYQRSNERIIEDVNENLTHHGRIDARRIQVTAEDGEVTLEGSVDSRRAKRMAEYAAEAVRGVRDVHNRLRIEQEET